MYLCSDGHAEIVYDSKDCPACELISKISDLEDEIYDLKDKITDLEKESE